MMSPAARRWSAWHGESPGQAARILETISSERRQHWHRRVWSGHDDDVQTYYGRFISRFAFPVLSIFTPPVLALDHLSHTTYTRLSYNLNCCAPHNDFKRIRQLLSEAEDNDSNDAEICISNWYNPYFVVPSASHGAQNREQEPCAQPNGVLSLITPDC